MLYIDLDGVLADFHQGISHEIWLLATGRKEIIGSKSAPKKIRNYIKENGRSFKLHTEESLKEKEVKAMLYMASAQKGFFLNLPKLPTQLLEVVNVPYSFLTGGINDYSVEDKKEWCRTVLGSDRPCNVVLAGNGKTTAQLKAEFCKSPNDILVDDNQLNIKAWKEAGGTPIHWKGEESLKTLLAVLESF